MLFAWISTNILANALPSLRIYPLLLCRMARITTIALLYGAALSYNVVYIQSIGSPVGIFSGLFHVTLISQSILYLVVALIIMPRSLLNTSLCVLCRMAKIVIIALLYVATIILLFFYVQLIFEYVTGLFGDLFNPQAPWGFLEPDTVCSVLLSSSLVPTKPTAVKALRLSDEKKAQFNLSTKQEEILVGCILGDLHVRRYKKGSNAYLEFEQGILHKDYLLSLYEELQDFCAG